MLNNHLSELNPMMKTGPLFRALFCAMACCSLQAATFVEPFDSDNSGWIQSHVRRDAPFVITPAEYDPVGGYLVAEILPDFDRRLYTLEATNTSLSWTDLLGQTLTVDQRISGTVFGSDVDARARFFIGRGSSYYTSTYAWEPLENQGWQTHAASVTAEEWDRWPSSGIGSFRYVATAPDEIGVVYTYGLGTEELGWVGNATVHLDNFGIVPEPNYFASFQLSALFLFLVTRRNRESN